MIKKRKKLTRVKNILIPLINANLSGEGGKKTRDKPCRGTIEVEGRGKKDWKICIISRWISLNSFVPRGSLFLFERRWAAFSANEKLINSRWRCWQSEEHAAPRINSPPFSPLSSLKRAALKKRERKKKEYCAQHAFTRQISSPWSGGAATPTRTIHLEIQCRFTRISSRHRIENGRDETISGRFFFPFIYFPPLTI